MARVGLDRAAAFDQRIAFAIPAARLQLLVDHLVHRPLQCELLRDLHQHLGEFLQIFVAELQFLGDLEAAFDHALGDAHAHRLHEFFRADVGQLVLAHHLAHLGQNIAADRGGQREQQVLAGLGELVQHLVLEDRVAHHRRRDFLHARGDGFGAADVAAGVAQADRGFLDHEFHARTDHRQHADQIGDLVGGLELAFAQIVDGLDHLLRGLGAEILADDAQQFLGALHRLDHRDVVLCGAVAVLRVLDRLDGIGRVLENIAVEGAHAVHLVLLFVPVQHRLQFLQAIGRGFARLRGVDGEIAGDVLLGQDFAVAQQARGRREVFVGERFLQVAHGLQIGRIQHRRFGLRDEPDGLRQFRQRLHDRFARGHRLDESARVQGVLKRVVTLAGLFGIQPRIEQRFVELLRGALRRLFVGGAAGDGVGEECLRVLITARAFLVDAPGHHLDVRGHAPQASRRQQSRLAHVRQRFGGLAAMEAGVAQAPFLDGDAGLVGAGQRRHQQFALFERVARFVQQLVHAALWRRLFVEFVLDVQSRRLHGAREQRVIGALRLLAFAGIRCRVGVGVGGHGDVSVWAIVEKGVEASDAMDRLTGFRAARWPTSTSRPARR